MVKFGKNKFKAINKLAKKQNVSTNSISNKVIKKKINAEKKVTFQKEVLLKEVASGNFVKSVSSKDILLNELSKKHVKKKAEKPQEIPNPKQKPVQKQKKRQKTQISDTKLLLSLMKKK